MADRWPNRAKGGASNQRFWDGGLLFCGTIPSWKRGFLIGSVPVDHLLRTSFPARMVVGE
jgi:hypothetical protein